MLSWFIVLVCMSVVFCEIYKKIRQKSKNNLYLEIGSYSISGAECGWVARLHLVPGPFSPKLMLGSWWTQKYTSFGGEVFPSLL